MQLGQTMKAARWHARRDVRIDDIPVPEPREDQALVAVEWCGICGTDVEEYRAGPVAIPSEDSSPTARRPPITLGHEIVGTVAQPAANGAGPREDQLVIPDVVVGCGTCFWCRRHEEGLCERLVVLGLQEDGGLAEYIVARADTCVPVPHSLGADIAALAEPTSVAVRAVRKMGDPVGSRVLILGAGTIGLLVAQVARAAGARLIAAVDPRADRRALALDLGADVAFDSRKLKRSLDDVMAGVGPDVVLECSGAPGSAGRAMRLTRRGGIAILVGFHGRGESFDLLDTVLGEKRVLGSAAHLWDEDVSVAVDLLARGKVDARPLISAKIRLDRVVEDGLERLGDPDATMLKILVTPNKWINPD
jgi:(R,R)-butanediol dehydrogenase / meso-butanediol dehydrogenase / diacetyl reductase